VRGVVVVHLDESCLGNGRDGATPGGAGALLEAEAGGRVERRDLAVAEADTTNNRMALAGATLVLEHLAARGRAPAVICVSDSEYLVRGMREWVPGWAARGWRRKGGPIENLERWQRLYRAAAAVAVQWTWVRGHAGHPKNEYANDLAVRAARTQAGTGGVVESGWEAWLAAARARGRYLDYDADAAYRALAAKAGGTLAFSEAEPRA